MTHARILVLLCLLAVVPALTHAQVATGTPPFGSFGGGPDVINLANLNSHLVIPILSKPGRGLNFDYNLAYDSSIWYPVGSSGNQSWKLATNTNLGWTTSIPRGGHVSYSSSTHGGLCGRQGTYTVTVYSAWTYWDGFGTPHLFPGNSQIVQGCSSGTTGFTATASDGSGYTLTVNAYTIISLIASDGAHIIVGTINLQDRNGNTITSSNSSGITNYYDTLSSSPVLTISGSGTPASSYVFTYTAPNGQSAAYTMKYAAYTVQTKFACSGINDYPATSNNLVSEIDLPDGSKYSFTYEGTPGVSGNVTGRLASVTLPTGGTITYSYSGGSNGINCADGSTATLTRTTPDGTWTYAQVKGTGSASTTTITDPQGNVTVSNFSGIYPTQSQIYQGSTSGTLLKTVVVCYNNNFTSCPTASVSLPITKRDVYRYLPGVANPGISETTYSAYGMLTEHKEMDYVPTSNGSPYLSDTTITYASLGNINAFRQQVTVKNNAGTIVSQTNYNYDETAVTATSGTPQHTSVSGSRGNLTSINYAVSGLTAHVSYYDTGTPNVSTDVNGATTTYSYDATSCGNAFPASVSEPLGLSKSMTWNCTGGVQLTATDENGKTVTTTYNDAYFWRPNAITDQLSNQTSFSYQPNPTYCCPTMVASSLTFNNGNSVVSDIQYKDGLGRTTVDQRSQSPNSSMRDTVSYTFDADGRPYSASMPCAVSGLATCSTPKTTQTYDALNRPLQTIDGGGGTVTNYYTQNDVLVTVSPAPSGENAKRRQLEYDALGRLTSVCEISGATGSGSCGQNNSQNGFLTKYTYDALNNLTDVAQNAQPGGNQQPRHYNYDAMSRLTSETNPESGTTNYTFDSDSTCGTSAGDLVKRVDAVGNVTCYSLDALHRITSTTYSGPYASNTPNKYFVYDGATVNSTQMANAKTRMAEAYTATSQTGTKITDIGFSYTPRGETADLYESAPHSGGYYHSNATYWPNGPLNALSGPIGYSMSWNVDGEGRVYSTSNTSVLTSTTYNSASQPTQVNFGSGDNDAFTYDPNTGRMTQYKFNVGATPQSVVGNLTWNANGTLGQLAITDPFNSADTQNCSYGYDDFVRLSSANCGSAAAQTFSFDAFGNINKSGSPYSFQPIYSAATNRMTSIGNITPTYDADGNVTNDGLHAYSWNVEGRPVTIDSVSVTYDALGRMVEQQNGGWSTEIGYSATGFKAVIASGQSYTKAFVPLPAGAAAVWTSSGLTYYRHSDWLGSSRFASTPSRTMYFDTAYAPFGEPYAQSGTSDLSFTGMNQDTVSGLYDFPAREYGIQGRWPSPDPAGLAAVDATNPQSWNRYAYVLNNPLLFVDPIGLCGDAFTQTTTNGVLQVGPVDDSPCPGLQPWLTITDFACIYYGTCRPGGGGGNSGGGGGGNSGGAWAWNFTTAFVKGWFTQGFSFEPGSCTAVFANSVENSAVGKAARSLGAFTVRYGRQIANAFANAGPQAQDAVTAVSAMAATGQLSQPVAAVTSNLLTGTAGAAEAAAPYVSTATGVAAVGLADVALKNALGDEIAAIRQGRCKP